MMETILSRSIRAICLGGMTLGMHAAFAQTASEPMQRVEVTGSRIRQVDLETAQPIQVMTAAQIQKTGLVTVGDILNNLSSAGSPDFSKGGSLTSNRESGGQYINLRNLGSNRLLVLVNGKRWTQTVDGYTDMSTVPASMVERIEILKDGASSIYGSDAIAGVVNIILKKSLEGGQLSMYAGRNQEGDGRSKDFSLSYGAGNDKASMMFGLSHTEQGVVWAKTRPITATSYGPGHPSSGYGTAPWGRVVPVNPATGLPLPATDADDNPTPGYFNRMINHTGNWDGVGVGSSSRDPNSYHRYAGASVDKFNSSQQMMFQMPTQLDTIFTKGTIQLPLDMTFSTTAMYSQRKSRSQVAGYPLNSLSQASYPVYISQDSYFNPYGNQVAGAGNGQDLYFARRTIELPRVTDNESRTLHIDATLEGNFALRGLPWNWSTGVNHSKVSGSTYGTGNLNLLNLKKAVGPSFMNASGVVQCGTPGAPIALAECAPFDILGGPSASTPAALAYVNSTGQATYGSKTDSITADIGGELWTLPAGALGFAAGVERREVTGYDQPGQFEQSGYSTDLAGNPTRGKYTVKEAYAELNIPVLKGVPFAELLSFNLASRYSDYSNFGTTTNSKASFMWKPIKDLLTRGTYAQGFRAPNVGDTFGGGQQSFDEYLDPCDTVFGDAAKDAAVQARCLAGGVPRAGFRQVDQSGTPITNSGGAQSNVPFNAGAGNAALTPETAVTRTLGFVYSPSFVPGLTTSVDWYSIKVDNRIVGVSAEYVANQCYIEGIASFCNALKRDASTGEIINLNRGNANLGQLKTEGVDLAINYRMKRTAWGQFGLRSETTYVDTFSVKSDAEGNWVNYAGEYYYNRVKSNLNLDWNLGNWSANWGMRYYSPVKDDCWTSTVECSMPTAKTSWGTGANKLGSTTYHDISVGYKTSWKGDFLVGVNNVFGKEPRITYNGAASSSAVDADRPIDRFFYVRYNQAF